MDRPVHRMLPTVLVLLFLMLPALPYSSVGAGTRADDGRPVALLPADLTSEFPLPVVIVGDHINGTGNVTGYIWNQTSGPAVTNLTEWQNQLNFTPPRVGIYKFVLRVTDDLGNVSDPAKINITVTPNNAPLVLPYSSTLEIDEDDDIEVDVSGWVSDPDEELSYSVIGSDTMIFVSPLGFGIFQIEPTEDFTGIQSLSFRITDEFNNSVTVSASVVVSPVPDAPGITMLNGKAVMPGTQVMEGYEDSKVWFNLTIEDPDMIYGGDILTLFSDRERITIEGSSGWFTPTQEDVGIFLVNFLVTDSYGLNSTLSVVLDVINVNDNPVLRVNGMVDTLEVGADLRLNFTGTTDPDGDTLTYLVKEDTGDWIQTQQMHVLNFETPGEHRVWFMVDDGNGGADVRNFTVTVTGEMVDDDVQDDDNIDDDTADDDDIENEETFLAVLIIAGVSLFFVLVIVGVLVLAMVVFRRKDRIVEVKPKKEEEEEVEVSASPKKKAVLVEVEEEGKEEPSPQAVSPTSPPVYTPPEPGVEVDLPVTPAYFEEPRASSPPVYPPDMFQDLDEEEEEEEEVHEHEVDGERVLFDEDEEEDGSPWGDEEDEDWEEEEEEDPWADDEDEDDDPW